jgi:hypothetical protein
MPLESLKPLDDADTRTEIFRILQLLAPGQRIDFLHWCSRRTFDLTADNQTIRFVVTHTTGEVAEVYWDLMNLVTHYGIDLPVMLEELERRGREKRAVPFQRMTATA